MPDIKNKTVKPTCVFKNETRARVTTKEEKHINKLGPGTYDTEVKTIEKPHKIKEKKVKHRNDMDYKRLKNIITNIVINEEDQANEEANDKEKEDKPNYMFIKDDRDRFGDQKYPIVGRPQVPGPGAYENKGSLEEHAQKIVVV